MYEPTARSRFGPRPSLTIASHSIQKRRRITTQFVNFNSRMPPLNTDAPPKKKHDRVGPAPYNSQLPAVLFGPLAAAVSLPSGKGIETVPVIDPGPTLEEQQRRYQTAMVIGDWEISAWYSIAGREVGLSLHFQFPSSFHTDILTFPSVIISEASYRIQLSDDSKRIPTR